MKAPLYPRLQWELDPAGWQPYAETFLTGLPVIRRARGYRLYDTAGARYLDTFLDEGRAVLGHRPAGVSQAYKNALSKGAAPYPSIYPHRLLRHLGHVFPELHIFRVYQSFERAMHAVAVSVTFGRSDRPGDAGDKPVGIRINDPALPPREGGESLSRPVDASIELWRPFLPDPFLPDPSLPGQGAAERNPVIVLPIFPFPGTPRPWIIAAAGLSPSALPESDPLSPAVLAGLIRSICDVQTSTLQPISGRYKGWHSIGPYLSATCSAAQYRRRFRRYLESGVLLHPRHPGPSILPLEWTEGEAVLFRRLTEEDEYADA